jgi:DNA polymerase-3 subunit delta'
LTVWDDVVGQESLVRQLTESAAAAAAVIRGEAVTGMTHAYLFTGPPGSGRSTAARAFAAALQCPEAGCGHCEACHTVLAGTHADVEFVVTELLSIGVKDTRDLVRRAALSPAGRRWQVIVMEDADRLTEGAGNVLLKSIEEPAERTVWMLCAPSIEDVLPTIRSRCRHLLLRTPPASAVAEVLVRRDGVDPAMAAFAARAAQGHIGRARRLARDEQSRLRRAEVLNLPGSLTSVGGCLNAAQRLVDAAGAEAREATEEINAKETEQLKVALGAGATGRGMPAGSAGALKELEGRQKKRATRMQRDALDRALVDLASFYRDVLVTQLGAGVELTNDELRGEVTALAADSPAEHTLRRIDAVLACREAIAANVAPLLAVEAMALTLRQPVLGSRSSRTGA